MRRTRRRAARRSPRAGALRPRPRVSARATGRRTRAQPTSAGGDRLAAVVAEEAHLAQLFARRLARSSHQVAGGRALGDDEREVLAQRRVGDHVAVEDSLGHLLEELRQVELEGAPRRRRWFPARAARPSRSAPSRRRATAARPVPARSGARSAVRRRSPSTAPFASANGAVDDAAEMPALARHLAVAPRRRQIDMRDLEQAHARVAHVDVVSRRAHAGPAPASCAGTAAATRAARAARSRSDRGRSAAASRCRPRRSRPRRARPRRRRRSRWKCVSRPNIACAHGQGRRDVLEPEAGDLLDHVDVAAHVTGAPRRNRHVPHLLGRLFVVRPEVLAVVLDGFDVDPEAEPLESRDLRRAVEVESRSPVPCATVGTR